MQMIEIVGGMALLFLCSVLLIKYFSLKQNLRRFSGELEKHKEEAYKQPVKVTDYDKDLVLLATKLNELTELQHEYRSEYEKRKKDLDTAISGISHDFRTPLTASLGYLQMMEKSKELSPKNEEYLQIVKAKNAYLKQLSDDFFEVSKLESQPEEIQVEKINVSNLLVEKLLEQHEWIENRQLETGFQISEGITISTDVHLLNRILDNLFSNTKKYAVNSVEVLLEQDGEMIRLQIRNGVTNTTALDIKRVFEPFYRSTERSEEGSGLGLYVVKLCVERLGGTVSAKVDEEQYFVIEVSLQNSIGKSVATST